MKTSSGYYLLSVMPVVRQHRPSRLPGDYIPPKYSGGCEFFPYCADCKFGDCVADDEYSMYGSRRGVRRLGTAIKAGLYLGADMEELEEFFNLQAGQGQTYADRVKRVKFNPMPVKKARKRLVRVSTMSKAQAICDRQRGVPEEVVAFGLHVSPRTVRGWVKAASSGQGNGKAEQVALGNRSRKAVREHRQAQGTRLSGPSLGTAARVGHAQA